MRTRATTFAARGGRYKRPLPTCCGCKQINTKHDIATHLRQPECRSASCGGMLQTSKSTLRVDVRPLYPSSFDAHSLIRGGIWQRAGQLQPGFDFGPSFGKFGRMGQNLTQFAKSKEALAESGEVRSKSTAYAGWIQSKLGRTQSKRADVAQTGRKIIRTWRLSHSVELGPNATEIDPISTHIGLWPSSGELVGVGHDSGEHRPAALEVERASFVNDS